MDLVFSKKASVDADKHMNKPKNWQANRQKYKQTDSLPPMSCFAETGATGMFKTYMQI